MDTDSEINQHTQWLNSSTSYKSYKVDFEFKLALGDFFGNKGASEGT